VVREKEARERPCLRPLGTEGQCLSPGKAWSVNAGTERPGVGLGESGVVESEDSRQLRLEVSL
jgi:hypothetical protein